MIAKRFGASLSLPLVLAMAMTLPPIASAESPPLFAQIGTTTGPKAGELGNPRGLAADPATGHIFVTETSNSRVSEFTAWGEFVKAWGWGVLDGGDELQVCTRSTECQQGSQGSGVGQLSRPTSAAVDSGGNLYVFESGNLRVQKFNADGEFLLMFGGEVNETTNANVCTSADVADGDVCGVGTPGAANGQFAALPIFCAVYSRIAVGTTGKVLVGDQGRIQEFDSGGNYTGQLALPEPRATRALAVDPNTGDLYVTLDQECIFAENPEVPHVLKHTASGWSDEWAEVGDPDASPFKIRGFPETLATDSAGNVYVSATEKQTGEQPWQQVLEFDSGADCLICLDEKFSKPTDGTSLTNLATSAGCNVSSDTLYVSHFGAGKSYVRAYGSTPDPEICPPRKEPPEVLQQYAISVDDVGAVVRASINPHYWSGGSPALGTTDYYVEYGIEECSKGGCQTEPLPPGAPLAGGAVNFPVNTAGVFLGGLQPGTTYHFRFVAESLGGGPVFGVDPDGDGPGEASPAEGEEGTFTTYPPPLARRSNCANQSFRTGPAAFLPDCRAYEMVSPVDKEGGEIAVLPNITDNPAGLFQGSPGGGKLSYSSYRAFGDSQSAPYTSQYIATRNADGWESEAISAPREGVPIPKENRGLDTPYKAFSSDLCSGWILQDSGPVLALGAPTGFVDLYRRDNCGDGSFEALNTVEPPFTKESEFWPEFQGFSADGGCGVFRANDKLTPDGSDAESNGNGIYQVYGTCDGQLRLLSVLPDGSASDMHSSAGTASGARVYHRDQSVWRAVSEDGSRVYWTAATGLASAPGHIYVRENADQDQSTVGGGGCEEAAKACTFPVSETVTGATAQFWTADPSGSRALFSVDSAGSPLDGNLYEYDFASKGSTPIAEEVLGLLGASEDLGRVYLVSREDFDGAAEAGEPNLYLYDRAADSFTFIATLSAMDATSGNAFRSPLHHEPSRRVARVTPDGEQVAFMSTAGLTGYDNTDVSSPAPCGSADGICNAEVYLFDATVGSGGELTCVSCNPGGVRPAGREAEDFNNTVYWVAAQIPAWEGQLYAPRPLAEDGSRLFFESVEPLVLRDTNGRQDVYEWERAGSQDACEEAGAELFVAAAGGCLSLISSGEGEEDSRFIDASLDGSDAFFVTGSKLLSQDFGLLDVYDARVGGGFPPPPTPRPPCEGEACQSPPAPPDDPTPASAAFGGQGNVVEEQGRKPRCGKGKRLVRRGGKARCVRKHQRRRGQKASRRAGGAR